MIASIVAPGSCCPFPRQTYTPADLAPEHHAAFLAWLFRSARFDGLGEEAAEEAASKMYLHWFARDYSRCNIGRGDHLRSFYAVRRYARRSLWQGFTGQRRARKAKITAEAVAKRERLREKNLPTPEGVAIAMERIGQSPAIGRKALKVGRGVGLSDVRSIVREACGFHDPAPATFAPAPAPVSGMPATDGDGTAWRGGNAVYDFAHGVQAVK